MTWKLLVGMLVIPYAVAAFLTGILYLNADLSSVADQDTAASIAFINKAGKPIETNIRDPAVGATNVGIATDVSYPGTAPGWLSKLAKSITLQGPMWEPWTQPIRFFLYLGAAPAMLMFTLMLVQALSFFISSILGRVSP